MEHEKPIAPVTPAIGERLRRPLDAVRQEARHRSRERDLLRRRVRDDRERGHRARIDDGPVRPARGQARGRGPSRGASASGADGGPAARDGDGSDGADADGGRGAGVGLGQQSGRAGPADRRGAPVGRGDCGEQPRQCDCVARGRQGGLGRVRSAGGNREAAEGVVYEDGRWAEYGGRREGVCGEKTAEMGR